MQAVPINKMVESMSQVDFSDLKCPMITIYEKPLDFPNAFIARVWDGNGPKVTNTIIMRFPFRSAGKILRQQASV